MDDRGLARRGTRRVLAGLGAAVILSIGLSACAGEPDPVARAQSQVTAKERALADAQTAFDAASDEFCSASESYVQALDRYGDLLNDTAPTVGDVRTAGADLGAPGEEAEDAAKAAEAARQAVVDAQDELSQAYADWEAALSAASSPPPPALTPTPTPTQVPVAIVDRVVQAEADLEAAQESISADTPLAEASEQFHSAAVGVELSWLALLVGGGCASDEQAAQAHATVAAYVSALQQDLTDAGYLTGAVDGVYGPETTAAVEALQRAHGLPVTGTVDAATIEALQQDLVAAGAAEAQNELATTAAVQQTLSLVGYWDGPIDGVWTEELTAAVMAFQTALGVPATGEVDAATVTAFHAALAELTAPEPEPSASPTP